MTRPPAIALAALDMAGTTVADDGVVERSFAVALAAAGRSADERVGDPLAFVRRTMGQAKLEVFSELFGGDAAAAERANGEFERAYAEAVGRGEVTAMAGAEEAMARLRAAGVRICLTTGFAPVTRRAIIDALDWSDRIDLALSPADAGRGRPWPDMLLVAVLRLEIEDVRAVAVAGDTQSDLWSGTRAGAGIVAGVLTGAHDRVQLEAAPHTHIIASVADLPDLVV